MNQILRAITIVGNASKLAQALGVSAQAVCFWRDGKRSVPSDHCPSIERETRARGEPVFCEELRPDVDWSVLRENAYSPAAASAAESEAA